tara:strand:+ start:17789 stop:18397 length:609 start_codon:yes stop_codon:yes gene_type:complete
MSENEPPESVVRRALANGYSQHFTEPINIPKPHETWDETHYSFSLRWHLDERGSLVELYRASWAEESFTTLEALTPFMGKMAATFGQAYISTTAPGVIKGWHLHSKQTDRFVVLRGRILLGLCNLQTGKATRLVLDSQRNPRVVCVPPGVAHGWKALGSTESWVLNICSHEYDGTDEYRKSPHENPDLVHKVAFDWNKEIDG